MRRSLYYLLFVSLLVNSKSHAQGISYVSLGANRMWEPSLSFPTSNFNFPQAYGVDLYAWGSLNIWSDAFPESISDSSLVILTEEAYNGGWRLLQKNTYVYDTDSNLTKAYFDAVNWSSIYGLQTQDRNEYKIYRNSNVDSSRSEQIQNYFTNSPYQTAYGWKKEVWKYLTQDSIHIQGQNKPFDYALAYQTNGNYNIDYFIISSWSGQSVLTGSHQDSVIGNLTISTQNYPSNNSYQYYKYYTSGRLDSSLNGQYGLRYYYNTNNQLIQMTDSSANGINILDFYRSTNLDSIVSTYKDVFNNVFGPSKLAEYHYSQQDLDSIIRTQWSGSVKKYRFCSDTYSLPATDTIYPYWHSSNGSSYTFHAPTGGYGTTPMYRWQYKEQGIWYDASSNYADWLTDTSFTRNHFFNNQTQPVEIRCLINSCRVDTFLAAVIMPYPCVDSNLVLKEKVYTPQYSKDTLTGSLYNSTLDTVLNYSMRAHQFKIPGSTWKYLNDSSNQWFTNIVINGEYNIEVDNINTSIDSVQLAYYQLYSYCNDKIFDTITFRFVNCLDSINNQPIDQIVPPGTDAFFKTIHSDTNATYQWQTLNVGSWIDLSDFGKFSGSNTDSLSIVGVDTLLNGTQYRCQITACNNQISEIGVLIVMPAPCLDSITTQPQSNTFYTVPGSAYFKVDHTDTNATYQWQQNVGTGWTNLSDFGFYTGTSTDSLQLNGITFAINGVGFRCLTQSCENDTSNIAILTVIDNVGIEEAENQIKVIPNPTTGLLLVDFKGVFDYKIYNINGQLVTQGKTEGQIDLTNLPAGSYQLFLNTTEGSNTHTIQKL